MGGYIRIECLLIKQKLFVLALMHSALGTSSVSIKVVSRDIREAWWIVYHWCLIWVYSGRLVICPLLSFSVHMWWDRSVWLNTMLDIRSYVIRSTLIGSLYPSWMTNPVAHFICFPMFILTLTITTTMVPGLLFLATATMVESISRNAMVLASEPLVGAASSVECPGASIRPALGPISASPPPGVKIRFIFLHGI